MEGLPPEMVSRILGEVGNPRDLIALTRASERLRESVLHAEPRLQLQSETLDWNVFASSGYEAVRGPGYLRLPEDDRLSRASRRVRGDLPLAMVSRNSAPDGIFSCLYSRALLYPNSIFVFDAKRTRGLGREDCYISWNKGELTVNMNLSLWPEYQEDMGKVASLQTRILVIGTKGETTGLFDEYSRYDDYEQDDNMMSMDYTVTALLSYMTILQVLYLLDPAPVNVPRTVTTLIVPYEYIHEPYEGEDNSSVRTLILYNTTIDSIPGYFNGRAEKLQRRFSNLRRLFLVPRTTPNEAANKEIAEDATAKSSVPLEGVTISVMDQQAFESYYETLRNS